MSTFFFRFISEGRVRGGREYRKKGGWHSWYERALQIPFFSQKVGKYVIAFVPLLESCVHLRKRASGLRWGEWGDFGCGEGFVRECAQGRFIEHLG